LSRSTRFALQLVTTAAGALLDYLVGRLTNKPTLGILSWVGVTLVAAAALDFLRDLLQEHRANRSGSLNSAGNGMTAVTGIIRGRLDSFRWPTVSNAVMAASFAGIAGYVLTLTVITLRFTAVQGGPKLGADSAYDQSAVAFISSYQSSSSMAWFIVACFAIALILRPPLVLPLGVGAVSVANAFVLALPPLSSTASQPQSQLVESLSTPDNWLLDLPVNSVLWGCAASFAIGVLACGVISQRLNQ